MSIVGSSAVSSATVSNTGPEIPVGLPIVVDLDHTLLVTDTLDEAMAYSLFHDPIAVLQVIVALPSGPLAVKSALAARGAPHPTALPLRMALVDWLRAKAEAGHEIHLCSAAHQSVVDAVARELPFISSAVGSASSNLKGPAKAAYLAGRFPAGFVYAGDSHADLAVWHDASGIVLVNTSADTAAAARRLGPPVVASFPGTHASLRDWIRAIRVHHWTKNVLVFAPFMLGQEWREPKAALHVLVAFLLLLLLTSSTYLLNDVADLQADRQHQTKRARPIASSRIGIRAALGVGVTGALAALLIGLLVSPALAAALSAYLALTLAYSLGLKRVALLDVVVIAVLFGLRLAIGIAVQAQHFSGYLMTFALFFFFSLAIAKRHTEILRAGPDGVAGLAARGYRPADAELTLVLGVAAGLGSVIVLVLYLMLDAFLRVPYGRPEWLWAEPMLIAIWLGRIWLLSHRGEMLDDPVSFAVRDGASWALGACVFGAYLMAL